jgi:hypothetical protein
MVPVKTVSLYLMSWDACFGIDLDTVGIEEFFHFMHCADECVS